MTGFHSLPASNKLSGIGGSGQVTLPPSAPLSALDGGREAEREAVRGEEKERKARAFNLQNSAGGRSAAFVRSLV